MACSQQYCCVLLQTVIELTVHFFSGGWNIKFDQILVLMLLHFASLTVFLDDRGICDHSTMTWEPQLWQEIALVMDLETCAAEYNTVQEWENGSNRQNSDPWVTGDSEFTELLKMPWFEMPFLQLSNQNPASSGLWINFYQEGNTTQIMKITICVFSAALLKLKLVIIFKPLQPLVFRFLFKLLFRETHCAYGFASLFSRTCLALEVCLNAFSNCFVICALMWAGISA